MKPYVPGHIIDEARDLRRQGHSLESLAGKLKVPPETMAQLLGEPTAKPATKTETPLKEDEHKCSSSGDLWGGEDRL